MFTEDETTFQKFVTVLFYVAVLGGALATFAAMLLCAIGVVQCA